MNKKITLVLAATLFCFFINAIVAQEKTDSAEIYPYTHNDAKNPCISAAEYQIIEKECNDNIKRLGLDKAQRKNVQATALNWPLQPAKGFTDCEYHFIAAYVDQNLATTAIQDYNCESNTYDGHKGTDIAVYPYGFYKMDNNQVEVIAAAPGTIIQKADGNYDRNCGSNTLTANSIVIQHADGTQAMYWHMKKNSLTKKVVGDAVVAGEFLGIVGSSGSASGPHLHFEVHTGGSNSVYNDPFSGTCNTINANSWWAKQKAHTNPAIIKASVNTTDVVASSCPTSETPNESNSYTIPFQGTGLAAGYAKFYIFMRELPIGASVDLKILNFDGTVFNSWTYTVSTYYKITYYGFSKKLPTNSGLYTFQATYNNVSCSQQFSIVNPLGVPTLEDTEVLNVYNNKTDNTLVVKADNIPNGVYKFLVTSITGALISTTNSDIIDGKIEQSIPMENVADGVYLITVSSGNNQWTKKFIK